MKEEPLEVEILLENIEDNGLGIPLPDGKVELYTISGTKGLEYIGADKMGQVPKGQSTKIISGRAFDVVGNRKVLNYNRQRKSEEAVIEIKVTNARSKEIKVLLVEHINGDWIIKDESLDYKKKDASTIHFSFLLNGGETKTFTTPTGRNGTKTLISKIGGIGKKREQVLFEHGISTIEDLLYYFPRRHLDRSAVTKIRNLEKGTTASIIAKVEAFGEKPLRNNKLFQVIVTDGTGLLKLTWFNGIYFMRKLFKVGEYLAIYGKVEWYRGPSINHPEFDKISFDNNFLEKGGIIPIYPLTSELKAVGMEQRMIRKMIEKLLFDFLWIFLKYFQATSWKRKLNFLK